jgi:hypothetical protein
MNNTTHDTGRTTHGKLSEAIGEIVKCVSLSQEFLDFIRFVNIPEIPLHSFTI